MTQLVIWIKLVLNGDRSSSFWCKPSGTTNGTDGLKTANNRNPEQGNGSTISKVKPRVRSTKVNGTALKWGWTYCDQGRNEAVKAMTWWKWGTAEKGHHDFHAKFCQSRRCKGKHSWYGTMTTSDPHDPATTAGRWGISGLESFEELSAYYQVHEKPTLNVKSGPSQNGAMKQGDAGRTSVSNLQHQIRPLLSSSCANVCPPHLQPTTTSANKWPTQINVNYTPPVHFSSGP